MTEITKLNMAGIYKLNIVNYLLSRYCNLIFLI